MTQTPVKKIND